MKIPSKRDLMNRKGSGEPTEDNICLSDISFIMGKLSAEASTLELQDNIEACKRSRELTFKAETLIKLYRKRVSEIRNEIRMNREKSGKKRKSNGLEAIKKINEQKSKH